MGFALSEMQLESSAFPDGGPIPARHTGEAEDLSPALAWSQAPEGTKSFAIICHDPDAPLVKPGSYGFVHWVAYNLAPDISALAEGATGHTDGVNDFGNAGYGGPMPPPGHGTHRYFFTLLALDCAPDIAPGLTMWELLAKVEPNLIGMNRLMGTYRRD